MIRAVNFLVIEWRYLQAEPHMQISHAVREHSLWKTKIFNFFGTKNHPAGIYPSLLTNVRFVEED